MDIPIPRTLAFAILCATLTACGGAAVKPAPPAPVSIAPAPQMKVGLALGGGAAKGFAHIGVIKMLEANGIHADVVAGTSAGSVVGALYASGMDPYRLQTQAFALDESKIRDVSLFSGGLVKGQKLQDYVNTLLKNRPMQSFAKPFAAVATELSTGRRTAFVRGNAGQAVRASSSIPGVFEPTPIGGGRYVDGGVVSPVPVDAARELGADFVIAVDISSKAAGNRPGNMVGIVNQSITIMGQKLGEQELARADIVIRPQVGKIGAADFEQKNVAILEGEKAAQAAMPQIKTKLAAMQRQRAADWAARHAPPPPPTCEPGLLDRLGRWIGREGSCAATD
ncbi:patatin-like phospholipase family protein [Lysobacter pythonis]|uniref:Patatin-like phospholipase family protein n=1 Tax=Solilutibacter pythonis TaxID=2483112 RepID=A0A3M2I0I4_9GAMM|nr:patatin-like phospholipase family protein [Lysobacter pythonis]RMH93895.1 patatin-like phospholipase family protein [Lysobacter pythonis]